MRRFFHLAALAALSSLLFSSTSRAQDSANAKLDQNEADRLMKLLTPDADQPWRTIPWEIDLLGGQRLAAQSGKPIFIWAMDGHPLGCT